MIDKDGVVFELSPTDCVKIVLNAANLPVALAIIIIIILKRTLL